VKEGWSTLQETKTLCPDVPGSTSQTQWLEGGEGQTGKKNKRERGRFSSADQLRCQHTVLK
jgi:hypothetical protein